MPIYGKNLKTSPEPKGLWPWNFVCSIRCWSTTSTLTYFMARSLRLNISNFFSRLKPNFMWSLHGMGERKYVQMVPFTWPRWPPFPYMVKTWKILLLWNQKAYDLKSLYAASGTRVLPKSTKFVQMMTLGWPWPILIIMKYPPYLFFCKMQSYMLVRGIMSTLVRPKNNICVFQVSVLKN